MDLIKATEDAIVAQLNAEVSDIRIDNDPDSALPHPKARALVFYSGEVADPLGTAGRSQITNMTFDIDVQMVNQSYGSHEKIYPYLEAIKDALNGFNPGTANLVKFISTQYQVQPDGDGYRWRYSMTFECKGAWIKG